MLARYVWADLVRNPRRTLSTVIGVVLGVGLFCGVLFFVDGLSASMTQRAVAPLPIDMQRILTQQAGVALVFTQSLESNGSLDAGAQIEVVLELRNDGDVAANEVVVRSVPEGRLRFVDSSAQVDGAPAEPAEGNPFAAGQGMTGLNLGTIGPGTTRQLRYRVQALSSLSPDAEVVRSSYSSREAPIPVPANEQGAIELDELARTIGQVDGVSGARQMSFADLGTDALAVRGTAAGGAARIFGFDRDYAAHDPTVDVVEGTLGPDIAVLSAEAATALDATIGDSVTIGLPDDSTFDATIGGIADLSRARSLFSSRRGGDLETFLYTPNSVIVSSEVFARTVVPAFERAGTMRGERLRNPPVREVDIALDRDVLASDPATALAETQRIGMLVGDIAAQQGFLLDNISNTLGVAAGDAATAKRLFVFLGVPGGFLAAMLAAYAGTVLAGAQRQEQAILRVRGAGQAHLRRMLALRTILLTLVGSAVGLGLGYLAANAILGHDALNRVGTGGLVRSGLIGMLGGLLATGAALYVTGRRTIAREIDEDRAHLASRPPLWWRARVDLFGTMVVVAGTAVALRQHAFDGAPGSVYFGRTVQLNIALLILPLAVWIAGSLVAARVVGIVLRRAQTTLSGDVGRPLPSLYAYSVSRRPWPIANGTVVVSLIVALTACLGVFTASYDAAKAADARYANGSDVRIAPSPTSPRTYEAADAELFRTAGIDRVTPVIYGVSNVILRSARTSDPANLAAINPDTFGQVAPLQDDGSAVAAASTINLLQDDPAAVLLSTDMAEFLKVGPGDRVDALLARATVEQAEVALQVVGLYQRMPGFPDGADAVMNLSGHLATVPSKNPDFFLGATSVRGPAGIETAVASLQQGPGANGHLQIDTRLSTLTRDQSSLAALNIAGLVALDSSFALAMAVVTVAIFVFGLLLERRREYITLRAQGLRSGTVRLLIVVEAGTMAVAGALAGVVVGAAMGFYFVTVLRPLFVLQPRVVLAPAAAFVPFALVLVAAIVTSTLGSRVIHRLEPTELLRDD